MSISSLTGQLSGVSGSRPPLDPAKLQEIQEKMKQNGGKPPEMDTSKIDQSKFLDQFTKDFGGEAAASIQNEDGTINFDKVKDFFDSKIEEQSSQQEAELLERFAADFGSEAAESIKGEDGKVDFAKLREFFEKQGDEEDSANALGNMDLASLVNGGNDVQAKLLDLLFGKANENGYKNRTEDTHETTYIDVQV